jgi:type IV pilus assembly protein PilP
MQQHTGSKGKAMFRPKKEKRRNGLRLSWYAVVLLFLPVTGSLCYLKAASAAPEIVYKGPKSKKALLAGEKIQNERIQPDKELPAGYVYDPIGKTDPFKSFIARQESVEEKKKRKPKTYLETLDLSQLDLVAIILSKKGNWAMVRDSKGLGHVIKKGTLIGMNEGVVHEIKDNELIVRERYKDFRTGQEKTKDTKKKLVSGD